jgi:hypothetical protein
VSGLLNPGNPTFIRKENNPRKMGEDGLEAFFYFLEKIRMILSKPSAMAVQSRQGEEWLQPLKEKGI